MNGRCLFACGLLVAALGGGEVHGQAIHFSISFDDPDSEFSEYYSDIERVTLVAAQDWARYLKVPDDLAPEIEIRIDFLENFGEASAINDSIWGLRQEGDFFIYRQGIAHEILTGEDINGDEPDGWISLNPISLETWYWFDPEPELRTAPVPGILDTDFYSLMLHELGHLLGYSGNLDEDGTPFFEWISEYDELVVVDDEGRLFFTGSEAQKVYGAPVPLTPGDYKHVGVRRDEMLENHLMDQPPYCSVGSRCYISPLDLAILQDTGLRVVDLNEEPTISIERLSGGGMRIEWQNIFGPVRVQASDTLQPGSWTDLTEPMGGWSLNFDTTTVPGASFFRVVSGE